MKRALLFALIAVTASACGAPAIKYTSNAQAIVEQMDKASEEFVRDIPLTATSRVAIVNLEGTMTEASSPSVPIYDMLAIALTRRKIPVVERDAEALYASVLESWSSRLPFRVTSPCGELCPVAPPAAAPAPAKPAGPAATIIVQGCSSSCASDAKPGECKTCSQPTVSAPAKDLVALVEEVARLRGEKDEVEAEAAAPAAPSAAMGNASAVPVASRSYRDLFSRVILPNWFTKDGGKIVAEQASATHILAYRVLTFGAAVAPTQTATTIRREIRIDLVLRLVRVNDGVVEWSDRVTHTYEEQLPAEVAGALADNPYSFFPSQYMPGDPKDD